MSAARCRRHPRPMETAELLDESVVVVLVTTLAPSEMPLTIDGLRGVRDAGRHR